MQNPKCPVCDKEMKWLARDLNYNKTLYVCPICRFRMWEYDIEVKDSESKSSS